MKVVFFGNTKYSLIGLKIIHQELGISAIVSITGSPVEKFAKDKNIPLLTSKKLTKEFIETIKNINPDFLIVEDYGLILPQALLITPNIAPLNIHHSLLPKYRGPSPVPSVILAGERIAGVTIIKMTSDVDAGDILAQEEYRLIDNETQDSLLTKLNNIGAKLVIKVINNFDTAASHAKKQGNSPTPYTPCMTRQSGFVNLKNPPSSEFLNRMVRAYYPWPGVWFKTELNGKNRTVKLLPNYLKTQFPSNPLLLQVEGKKPMTYKDFINGYKEGKGILEKLKLI